MKKIRVWSRTVKTFYSRCPVCLTKYSGRVAKAAKTRSTACSVRHIEKRVFKRGDAVVAKESRSCPVYGVYYKMSGRVVKVLGPERLNDYVYQYEVKYACPICLESRTHLYYAPEIKLLKPKGGR